MREEEESGGDRRGREEERRRGDELGERERRMRSWGSRAARHEVPGLCSLEDLICPTALQMVPKQVLSDMVLCLRS